MWKLMDNWINRVGAYYIPILYLVTIQLSIWLDRFNFELSLVYGIAVILLVLLVIAWGDKNPSIVMATPDQLAEASKGVMITLSNLARGDNDTTESILKEAEEEVERRRMIA